jgi:acetyl esterase/lipase
MQSLSFRQLIGVHLIRLVSNSVFGVLALRKRDTVVVKQEFRYGSHRDERLDYMSPGGSVVRQGEAIVYIHGGGWISCSKRFYPADLQFLCDAGYPVFNVEYPLAPEYPAPYLLQSILRAVAWIRRKYPEIKSVHMMGDSAGANLSAMYGVLYSNPELLPHLAGEFTLDHLLPPQSIVSLYGLLDRETILDEDPEKISAVVKLFLQSYGGPDVLQRGSIPAEKAVTPMDLDWNRHPPCFLGVGDIDFLFESSERYSGELKNRNIPYTHKIYPKAPHGFFNFFHKQRPALRQDVLDFLADVA